MLLKYISNTVFYFYIKKKQKKNSIQLAGMYMSNRAEKYLWIKQPKIQLIIFSQRNSLQAVPPFMYLVGSVQFYCWSLSLSLSHSLSPSPIQNIHYWNSKCRPLYWLACRSPPSIPPFPLPPSTPTTPHSSSLRRVIPKPQQKKKSLTYPWRRWLGTKKGWIKVYLVGVTFYYVFLTNKWSRIKLTLIQGFPYSLPNRF